MLQNIIGSRHDTTHNTLRRSDMDIHVILYRVDLITRFSCFWQK